MIQQNSFVVGSESSASLRISPHLRLIFLALLLATFETFLAIDARSQEQNSPTQPSAAAKPAARKKFRLRITKGDMIGVSLKADQANMTDLAADVAKQLSTQVILGPNLKKAALTVEFRDLLLEPALRLLAPRVFIDYEVQANAKPTMLGIYLLSEDDPNPAANAIVQSGSEAILIEGNTEDTSEPAGVSGEEDPLQVELDDNYLTIKSKKQPLIAVVMTIAEVLGVPAEIKYDSSEIVDTNIKDVPLEDAIARLSPNIRLFVRADLAHSQRTPLRLMLVPPPAPKVADAGNQ